MNSPKGLDSSNDIAAAAWTQEVYALAYSLQVVARCASLFVDDLAWAASFLRFLLILADGSNVRGWKVTDAQGEPLAYRTLSGHTAEIASKLLAADSTPKRKKG